MPTFSWCLVDIILTLMSQPASGWFRLLSLSRSLVPVAPPPLCHFSACLQKTFCQSPSAYHVLLSPSPLSRSASYLFPSFSRHLFLPVSLNAWSWISSFLSFSRKARDSLPTFRQFFSSAFSLSHVSLASMKVPPDSLRWVTVTPAWI